MAKPGNWKDWRKVYVLLLTLVGAGVFAAVFPLRQLKRPVGPHFADGRFINPWPAFTPNGFPAFLKWQWDRFRGRAPAKPAHYSFDFVQNDGGSLRANTREATVTWVGHATTILQLDGLNILTDPIWSERCSPVSWLGPRRKVPPVPALKDLPPIDAVVISHNHYDHLDKATIRRLGNGVHYFVPLFMKKWLQSVGIQAERITDLDWWQSAEFRGIEFVCLPAQHFSGRSLHDTNKVLWCGWAMLGSQHKVYFAGDTGYFPEFAAIGEAYGPFDLALMPIGAYLPRWFMHGVHVDPAEAARAFLEVKARRLLPIHWRTFDLADEPMDEPPRILLAAVDSLGIDRRRVWLLKQGETRVLAGVAE